jgi:hypothetical protein
MILHRLRGEIRAGAQPAPALALLAMLALLGGGCAAPRPAGLAFFNRDDAAMEVAIRRPGADVDISSVTVFPYDRYDLMWDWGEAAPAPAFDDGTWPLKSFELVGRDAMTGETLWTAPYDAEPWLDRQTGEIVTHQAARKVAEPRHRGGPRFVRARSEDGLFVVILRRDGPIWLFDPKETHRAWIAPADVARLRRGITDF